MYYMYGVIYWEDDDTLKPLLNKNGTLTVFERIEEADKAASDLDAARNCEARVISLEAVDE